MLYIYRITYPLFVVYFVITNKQGYILVSIIFIISIDIILTVYDTNEPITYIYIYIINNSKKR